MDYSLFRLCNSEPVDALEAHVLARAYHAAWRAFYRCEPIGRHTIANLGLAINYSPRSIPDEQAAPCN
jgi:hypothetical protein